MRNRKTVMLAALLVLLSPAVLMAQTSGTEPLRVIQGEMRGRTVTGQFKRAARATEFSFTITKAEIVGGRLQLTGNFALAGTRAKTGDRVTATIAGVMAKAADPWPSARDERRSEARKSKEEEKKSGEQQQGREAKTPEAAAQLGQLAQSTQDTARKTPPGNPKEQGNPKEGRGEKTEQTQSLYAQAQASAGCAIMFLSLSLPDQLRSRMGRVAEPLQLGVVLKPFDNERGEEINKMICKLLETREGDAQSASLGQLNRLLASSN